MHYLSSLFFFTIILILALSAIQINAKPTQKPAAAAASTTVAPLKSTSKAATTTIKPHGKVPAAKPAVKVDKKKKKPEKKSEIAKSNSWAVPNAAQKKVFNDYKAILRAQLLARKHDISATYVLEPAKYGSQEADKTILHHYLIKLPDSKYAHAIIATNKDPKKPTQVSENNASIRRTVYDNLAAAEV
ncbi:unnamed protein product [Rotaria socialis]|uniref:Uncharacterized protein n=1 Tax=Rotaria socialis TaxID=392032 RepID=A0A820L2Q8_9BILA|nr:unnamed protein product [Rotaria socialis]CAF3349716.1 unnamed protein product [Rotaria socialis]CAF3386793.1 unnamed protein product [Rotaria socialis]CAF3445586.1 unnamed protein product [Rotaria socialis]CAF3487360.1 unnamed protein product [Rotaria socialis]